MTLIEATFRFLPVTFFLPSTKKRRKNISSCRGRGYFVAERFAKILRDRSIERDSFSRFNYLLFAAREIERSLSLSSGCLISFREERLRQIGDAIRADGAPAINAYVLGILETNGKVEAALEKHGRKSTLDAR